MRTCSIVLLCLVSGGVAAAQGSSGATLTGRTFSILPAGEAPVYAPVPGTEGLFEITNAVVYAFYQKPDVWCCANAIWYVAQSTSGPWALAERIPAGIVNAGDGSSAASAADWVPDVEVTYVAGAPYYAIPPLYTTAAGTVVCMSAAAWTAIYLDEYWNDYVVCYSSEAVSCYTTAECVASGSISYSSTTTSAGGSVTTTTGTTAGGTTVTQATGPAGGSVTTVQGQAGSGAVATGPGGGKAGAWNGTYVDGAAVKGPGGASAGAVSTPNHDVGWVTNGQGDGYVAVDGNVYQVEDGQWYNSSGEPVSTPTPETTGSVAQGNSDAARTQSRSNADKARTEGKTYASADAARKSGRSGAASGGAGGTSGAAASPSARGGSAASGAAPGQSAPGQSPSSSAPGQARPGSSGQGRAGDAGTARTGRGPGSSQGAARTGRGPGSGWTTGGAQSGGARGLRGQSSSGSPLFGGSQGSAAGPAGRGQGIATGRSSGSTRGGFESASFGGASNRARTTGSHPFGGRSGSPSLGMGAGGSHGPKLGGGRRR